MLPMKWSLPTVLDKSYMVPMVAIHYLNTRIAWILLTEVSCLDPAAIFYLGTRATPYTVDCSDFLDGLCFWFLKI